MENLRDEVETVLHKLEDSVAALDQRRTWDKVVASARRGPWILAGLGVLLAGALLRHKVKAERKSGKSPGRAAAAGAIAIVGLLAKRWAKRLWSGSA